MLRDDLQVQSRSELGVHITDEMLGDAWVEHTFAKLAAGMPCANKNLQTGLMSCSTSSLRACRQHVGILAGLEDI